MSKLTRSAYGLDSGRDTDWRKDAECATGQYDINLWASPVDTDLGQARWVCQHACPVLLDCLRWAGEDPRRVEGTVAGGVVWVRMHGRVRLSRLQPTPVRPTGRPAHVDSPATRRALA